MSRLDQFIKSFTDLIERETEETKILTAGKPLIAALVAKDDWLPDDCAQPDPTYYRQYLLYRDPQDRFSLVSFVWGPGQSTPVHNHTVWGILGQLRGSEISTGYEIREKELRETDETIMRPGFVDVVSPSVGDIHKVRNGGEGVSISVHVYGANIGSVKRSVFDPVTGEEKSFVSGYANA